MEKNSECAGDVTTKYVGDLIIVVLLCSWIEDGMSVEASSGRGSGYL